jgi:hypothetical protein
MCNQKGTPGNRSRQRRGQSRLHPTQNARETPRRQSTGRSGTRVAKSKAGRAVESTKPLPPRDAVSRGFGGEGRRLYRLQQRDRFSADGPGPLRQPTPFGRAFDTHSDGVIPPFEDGMADPWATRRFLRADAGFREESERGSSRTAISKRMTEHLKIERRPWFEFRGSSCENLGSPPRIGKDLRLTSLRGPFPPGACSAKDSQIRRFDHGREAPPKNQTWRIARNRHRQLAARPVSPRSPPVRNLGRWKTTGEKSFRSQSDLGTAIGSSKEPSTATSNPVRGTGGERVVLGVHLPAEVSGGVRTDTQPSGLWGQRRPSCDDASASPSQQ